VPRIWLAVVVALALTSPRAARAESAEAQVERLASEATNAYKGADYNRAVELLTRAYEIRQVPALLYNLAKAYDKLGDVDHAYDAFRRYSDSADADPKLKTRADARLVVLEDIRRKKAAATRAAQPPPEPKVVEPAKPARVEPPVAPPPTPEEMRATLKAERDRQRRRDRYTALGVGVGALAMAGVAVGLSANAVSLQDQFGQTLDASRKKSLKSDAQISAGVADGFYAATAVAAAVTAYYLYRGFRAEPNAPSLVAPSFSARGAGLVVQGRF
jgi:tetratricopeptide (TPR) repeat protein